MNLVALSRPNLPPNYQIDARTEIEFQSEAMR